MADRVPHYKVEGQALIETRGSRRRIASIRGDGTIGPFRPFPRGARPDSPTPPPAPFLQRDHA